MPKSSEERSDRVSPALRAAEKEVDRAFSTNPLVARDFAEAAWSFLAFCEDRIMIPIFRTMASGERDSVFEDFSLADEVINHAKWPLRWLKEACPVGGKVPRLYDADNYTWSKQLSD